VVANAIKENLNKQGIKEEKLKGYQVFKGVKLNDYDSEVVDLYFKVDKKSRKDKNNSVVSMIIGRPNENVALRTTDDTHRISDGKDFLNSLIPAVEEKNLEVNISEQDATVNKSQKKLRKLEDQQKNLERKIRNLEDKLAENKKDQESENEELNKQRSMKEAMQGRRSDSQ
jgi:chromosome segregation ATPase